VLRDRNAIYRELPDGSVENVYTLRIINKDTVPHEVRVRLADAADMAIDTDRETYTIEAGEVFSVPARVRIEPGVATTGPRPIEVVVESVDREDLRASQRSRFLAPVGQFGAG
ncbi:MAG TPA: FixG Ig-like domain-containing protein, partial [Steroidobacteraceae bacterium]|nr:FixG Ig-like domain-containing protein [Steroidobacteraceae bacterium]